MAQPSFLQNSLSFVLRNFNVSPETQHFITGTIAKTSSLVLNYESQEITLDRHPLQTLYHLIERAVQGPELLNTLYDVPETLRNSEIFGEIYNLTTDSAKESDPYWGQNHALDDPNRLLTAIKNVVEKRLDKLSSDQKNALYGTIYRMAGQPQSDDSQWGEHHAKDDTLRLIRALHRDQLLDIRGKQVLVYSESEKNIPTPSCSFHLNRQELPRGQIGMHNGMDCPFEKARSNALKISNNLAEAYNLHCTYGAHVDIKEDLASAVLGQGGVVTPPVLQILNRWQDYFETNDSDRYLQLCHSRGAIEVYNALTYLTEEQRQRIIIITIAPACIIPKEMAYKVINLVIPSDPIPQIASNRHLMDEPYVWKLPPHTDAEDPHYMHGSSYREKLNPLIKKYIETNDID